MVCCCYYSYDMILRVRIYMPHSSAVVVLTRVYVASPRHTRQLRAVALSPEEATPIWYCSVHTAAAAASCKRRAGLTRNSCSFKMQSDTYRRTFHDTPCSLFVGHPGEGKHTLIKSKQCDTQPTADLIMRHVTHQGNSRRFETKHVTG